MPKREIKVFNVTDHVPLPSLMADNYPEDGDPLEINHKIYYVCKRDFDPEGNISSIAVILLVVKNPKKVENIKNYINCLSIARRRVQFRKENKACDLDDYDEMIIL